MLPARRIFSKIESDSRTGSSSAIKISDGRIGILDLTSDNGNDISEQNGDLDSGIIWDLEELIENQNSEAKSTSCSVSELDQDELKSKSESEASDGSHDKGVGFIEEFEYVLEEFKLNRNEYFWTITDLTALEMNAILSEIGFLILKVNGLIQQTSKFIQNPDSALALNLKIQNSNSGKLRQLCRREMTNLILLQRRLIRESIRLIRLQGQYLNQLYIQNDFDFSCI